jgi:DNA-binding NarL/FixJ family response regulator
MQTETYNLTTEGNYSSASDFSLVVMGGAPLFRCALEQALAAKGCSVSACAGETELAAICASETEAPAAVIFVVDSSPMSTLSGLQRLLEKTGSRPIVIASLDLSVGAVHAALRLGAKGVVGRDAGVDELLRAVRMAVQGKVYLDPELAHMAVRGLPLRPRGFQTEENEPPLSRREQEVVSLLCDGLAPKEVARRLHLSVKTVENHKHSIYRKCQVSNGTSLLRYAIQHSLVSL